ncbi:MAG: glutamate--tRNA ligase [Hyphomonadaceae bacterium]|nr:glutamate--tRNA ligase [Hyphomonadaceae bacterium]
MSVVTRFAPSPTGYLHIGGARTALFNWLFARKMGGKYLLRIEDTDRARSTPEAIAAIIEGLDWLDLQYDGEITYQFARAPRHREAAEAMIERGTAFRCYMTAEEAETVRAEAHAQGRALRSIYRDGKAPPSPDAPFVVRLRAPDEGEILNADLIQGDVRIKARDIDDLVLLRADGTPTYMLSVVVDDHDMGVTHVIRGDDHLTNAARQIPIFQAMGWTPPKFAHVPLIHGEDGKKLSKRHGAQAVHEWRDMGYLPEAMNAYLMRLGWSPGHDDILTKEEAVSQFDIAHIGKAPARLDFKKLDSVNAHFMALADDTRLMGLLLEHLGRQGVTLSEVAQGSVSRAMPLLKTRAKTIPDLAEQARFLLAQRPLSLDDKAKGLLKDEARQRLKRLSDKLEAQNAWEHEVLAAALKAFATDEGVGLGQIGPALRAALTGGAPSPDLGQTLELLGREEALARIKDQV